MNTVTTPIPPFQLIAWTPPAWTATISTNGELIECSRTLGAVPDRVNRAGDVLTVILVQRDEIRPGRDRVEVVRHPVEILVGGVSLSSTQAQGLSRLVDDAVGLSYPTTPSDAVS